MNFSHRLCFSLLAASSVAVTADLANAASSAAVVSDWNIVDHVPAGKVIIQSHRGAGVLAEENTVAAFELGWRLGTYPESDLRTTRDGVIVTFHDGNFSRVVKGADAALQRQGVKDLTFAELMKLDVGAWKGDEFVGRRVSRLTDAFAVMRGQPERHLYLDIKNVDFKALAAEVHSFGVERQIVLASPKPEVIRQWKALVPESDTLLWMRGSEAQLNKRLSALRKTNFAGITQLQIHVFPNRSIEEALAIAGIPAAEIEVSIEQARRSTEPYTLSRRFIVDLGRELRAHGILFQALPYTSDAAIYASLLDLGIASFATDHPDVTLREIKNYYDQRNAAKTDSPGR